MTPLYTDTIYLFSVCMFCIPIPLESGTIIHRNFKTENNSFNSVILHFIFKIVFAIVIIIVIIPVVLFYSIVASR